MNHADAIDADELANSPEGPDDRDRAAAIASIRALDRRWRAPATPITVGTIRWRPDLWHGKHILHLALAGEIASPWRRRMYAARKAGFQLTTAIASRAIETATLLELQELDTRIAAVDLDLDPVSVRVYRSVADWIATERIALSPPDLSRLATARLDEALAEGTSIKGRFFEEVLCLLFSQVSWLTVDEHAYRNASEEIDLVLGIHAIGYVAELAKGAVAVATAKNEAVATGSETVKYLKEQMANRKGRCRLGFLCSATTISADARTEILRGSQQAGDVIAQLDQADLRRLLAEADRLDEGVQRLVRRAVAS